MILSGSKIVALAQEWQDNFDQFAADLWPGRYSFIKTLEMVEMAYEMDRLAQEKGASILVHNYLPPEFHEMVNTFGKNGSNAKYRIGDSLGLSQFAAENQSPYVYFFSVYFMAATAKLVGGEDTRVFTPDKPHVLSCSLVEGTDYDWIEDWQRRNPGGVMLTYINSDALLKSMCYSTTTSANTDKIIVKAVMENPDKKILVLPDKFLGQVMKIRALDMLRAEGIPVREDQIEIYHEQHNGRNACCYVHEEIGKDAALKALDEHPGAELLIHPECGCSATCMTDLELKKLSADNTYILSTEGMAKRAAESNAQEFIVATEKDMIYRLRRENAHLGKTFTSIHTGAVCKFMQGNTMKKALASMRSDALEIVYCDDCCGPRNPMVTDTEIHIQRSVAVGAKASIDRMLQIT